MGNLISSKRSTCALGAFQTVLAIPRGIPILHSGPGCADRGSAFVSAGVGQGEEYAGGSNIVCTNASEQEVVFGGEDKLRSTIEGALEVMRGDLFVVLTGCTADIVGDDSLNVVDSFARQGYPIVGVETGGFKGNNYYGHEEVVKNIIEQFVGDVTPRVRKGLVNVFGVVPSQDPFWRGDLEAIKALLESIGLEVNILFGYESKGVSEWLDIPNADFNLLLSPWVGLSVVELLERKYNTPYLHYGLLPVGAQESSKFLFTVGKYAKIPHTVVERVIEKEERRFYKYFTSLADFLGMMKTMLPFELYSVADSIYTTGLVKFLVEEVGYIPKGVYITDEPSAEGKNVIKNIFERELPEYKDLLTFEEDGANITKTIRAKLDGSRKALILGSAGESKLAAETGNLCASISLPISKKTILSETYIGYSGGLRILEEVYSLPFRRGDFSAQTRSELVFE